MFRNILKIFTGTFISRIFGFIREIIVARYFGASKIADAFTLALTFPNLFRQVLGEDMVERAFMPPFKTIYDRGEVDKSWRYISIVFNWFFLMLLLATFILYLVVPLFFSLKDTFPEVFHFIFKDQHFDYDLTLKLVLILLPFSIFIGVAAFLGSMLNYFEKNWIFGFAPAMLSVGVILGITLLEDSIGGYAIAVGYVFGAILQMLIQLPFVFNRKFKSQTRMRYHGFKLNDTALNFKSIKRESRFITLNAFFDKSQEIFGRFFAATLITGSTSSLFYAARLYQLPFAIISLPITRGINPLLNKMKATKDYKNFDKIFFRGINLYLLLFFPVTAIMCIGAPEIVNLVYMRGKFDQTALSLTAEAFMAYSFGLLPMSLVGYYKRVLSLFDKNKFTLNISIIGAGLNIGFAVLMVKLTPLGHAGIALASSLAFFINMVVLGFYTFKEIKVYLQQKISWTRPFVLGIVLAGIVILTRHFDLYFYETKGMAVLSFIGKSVVVFVIFGIIYFLNKDFRSILTDFLGKR